MNQLLKAAQQAQIRPRVHGNGFVQLDLSPTVRLHVWGHPKIPRQKVESPIHDHRFNFTSLVLRGTMINQLYRVVQTDLGATHMTHRAKVRKNEDTILEPTGEKVRVEPTGQQVVPAGDYYTMTEDQVHESIVQELTVTIILKNGSTLAQGGPPPRVFVPIGNAPDNDFDRYSVSPADLWKIILEAVR